MLFAALGLSAATALAQGGCQPVITIDTPKASASIQGTTVIGGWAVDSARASGNQSGIQDIAVYRDGDMNSGGVLLGHATKTARADVDAAFGLSNAMEGWALNVDASAMSTGSHTIYVDALTGCGWTSATVPITVTSAPEITVDTPSSGQTIALGQQIDIGGWAADAAGSGTGVDQVQVYADGQMNSGGTLLGSATYGKARTDVAAAKGKPEWTNAGFDLTWTVNGLTPGNHTLYIYAHSTATSQWTYKTVDVTVGGGAPSNAGYNNPGPNNGYNNGNPYNNGYNGNPYYNGAPPYANGYGNPYGNGYYGSPCDPAFNGGYYPYSGYDNGCVPPPPGYFGGYPGSPYYPGYGNGIYGNPIYGTGLCPPGYAYTIGGCTLISSSTTTGGSYANCPAVIVGGSAQCVSGTTNTSCPAGYTLTNGTCSYNGGLVNGTCPAGYISNGVTCIYTGTPGYCPPGYPPGSIYQGYIC
jgi:hypothetical protein